MDENLNENISNENNEETQQESYAEETQQEEKVETIVEPTKTVYVEKTDTKAIGKKYIILTIVLCMLMSIASAVITATLMKNQATTTSVGWVAKEISIENIAATDYTSVVEKIEDSVVEIYTEQVTYGTYYGSYISEGAGSGVVMTTDGYIITNNHVIDGANTITVKLHDGESYDATLIATDPQTDIAVIKINANNLTPAIIGNSDSLKVGQNCVAVGNPLGTLGGTVTAGIISALSREITVEGTPMNLLQINVSVSPGNSGGGLFNTSGELIGIVNAKSNADSSEGIGFAIPVNEVINVATQLIEQGYVTGRAMLGIQCVSIENVQTAWNYGVNTYGVYVAEIVSDSLKESGLQVKDVIVQFAGKEITSLSALKTALYSYSAGDKVSIVVVRGNEKVELEITLVQKK